MAEPAVKKHPFGDGGFSGVDMGNDADVAKVMDIWHHNSFQWSVVSFQFVPQIHSFQPLMVDFSAITVNRPGFPPATHRTAQKNAHGL
jgi:hypothetical protein